MKSKEFDHLPTFSRQLRRICLERGMTQHDLFVAFEEIGHKVSWSWVGQNFCGYRSNPDWKCLQTLSTIFGVTVDYFFDTSNRPPRAFKVRASQKQKTLVSA